jgi:hypothetical protein
VHERIVGGYDVQQNKPWAARVWINEYDLLCGGSLINKRYILTAAHCICKARARLTCKQGRPTYNIKRMTTVYLGVNRAKVNNDNTGLKGDHRFSYGVEKGLVYLPEKVYHDIGLLRLDRDAVIVKNVLQPICLPLKFDKSDTVKPRTFRKGRSLQVYTSGWGRLFSSCTTDELGPVKSMKCRFPFRYRGSTISGCSRTRTPSAKDKECLQFRRKKGHHYPKKPGDSVRLISGHHTTTCHAIKARDGWCMADLSHRHGKAMPDSMGWGWCEKHCKYRAGTRARERAILAQRLQETRLDLLPMKHCRLMTDIGSYTFVGRWEVCAGKRKKFGKIKTYNKTGKHYKLIGNKIDFMGVKGANGTKYPLSYYIGGTDSCSGDSGGGLYTWRHHKPYLIGVVSRGFGSGHKNGCAERNFPGVYSRVSKYLAWIHKHSKTGNC